MRKLNLVKASCHLLALAALSLSFQFTSIAAQASSLRCAELFQQDAAPKSIHYYIRQVSKEQQNAPDPKFVDPMQEIALSQRWGGTRNAPRAIKDTLLETTALIDIQLLAADAGSVKIAKPGNLISLRLNEKWNGLDMSTNIGMSVDAILARSLRGEQQLVPRNANGVIIFKHGGGTKTTGHHVAAALSNFMAPFGIVVISMDAPFHAYGPRTPDLKPLDYYRYLVDFRNKYIPDNVPTFIGGHSMGGLHADNIMRLSDRPELGLRKAFAGAINLSGPMDAAPGKSHREKARVEEKLNSDPKLLELIPEAERDLSVLLLTQGKTSALGGVSAHTFMGLVNWSKPSHGGKEYLPTLAVMGARDGLMVGREKIFEDYIAQLSNTETHVIGPRQDFKGHEIDVAHMIFDHYRPGTKNPETFLIVKEFIEKQLGRPLEVTEAKSHPLYDGFNLSQIGILGRMVQEYYNNLAFRKFADQYTLVIRDSSPKIIEYGRETAELSKRGKQLSKEIKQADKMADRSNNKEVLEAELAQVEARLAELRGFQLSTYIPKEGPLKEFAQENVSRRAKLNQQFVANTKEKKSLFGELRTTRQQRESTEKEVEKWVERVVEFAGYKNAEDALSTVDKTSPVDRQAYGLYWGTSAPVVQARRKYDQALKVMIDLQVKMNEANNEMVLKDIERGDLKIDPPKELIEVYKELDQAYANYIGATNALRHQVRTAILRGSLGKELKDKMLQLWGSEAAYKEGAPGKGSLVERTEYLAAKVERIELENSSINREINELLLDYLEQVTPGLYDVQVTTLKQELDRPLDELLGHSGHLEKLWKDWVEIWKERPPEQDTSLY